MTTTKEHNAKIAEQLRLMAGLIESDGFPRISDDTGLFASGGPGAVMKMAAAWTRHFGTRKGEISWLCCNDQQINLNMYPDKTKLVHVWACDTAENLGMTKIDGKWTHPLFDVE